MTAAHEGFYGRYAGFARDFEGEYFEVGYGTLAAGLDLAVAVIFANSDLVRDGTESIVFTLAKSFDLD